MIIYVETNFVLELVFQQEQHEACEHILQVCEQGKAHLVIPAYSVVEPHEKLLRQARNRKELQRSLNDELKQLTRTAVYAARVHSIQDIARLLVQSNEEEAQRFEVYRERIIHTATIVSLTQHIILEAASLEIPLDLSPQDALVYATVRGHLRENTPPVACFLNKNTKDFDSPDITDELSHYNCRLIAQFYQGLAYIQSHI